MDENPITIRQFRKGIRKLPVDTNDQYPRKDNINRTQHQHWLAWLGGWLQRSGRL
jgi:hypothetical protein